MQALVTSASRKVPLLRAIRAQVREVDPLVEVTAADADDTCLAAFAWDRFITLPTLQDEAGARILANLSVLAPELLVPTRDGDVAFFAEHRSELAAHGTWCMAGSPAAVSRCRDKLTFAAVLGAAGVAAIPTVLDPAELSAASLVVKERTGAGGHNVTLDVAPPTALVLAEDLIEPVFQPFVPGPEVSVDAYRSHDGRLLGLVARRRDLVIGGESQVSTTIDAMPYAGTVTAALAALDLVGPAVLQLIDGPDGSVVVECNPRLGGASTLSLAAGLKSIAWAWLEAAGADPGTIAFEPAEPGLRLVRTPADAIGRLPR